MSTQERNITDHFDTSLKSELPELELFEENRCLSFGTIRLCELVGDDIVGSLAARLIIRRDHDPTTNTYTDRERVVRIGFFSVQSDYSVTGMGMIMFGELEAFARDFCASRITCAVSKDEIKRKPWLKVFYEDLGFKLEEGLSEWQMVKELTYEEGQ